MKKIIANNLMLYKKYYEIDPSYVIIRLISSILQIVQPLSAIWFFKLFIDGIFVRKSFSYCVKIAVIIVMINLISQIVNSFLNNRISLVSNQKVDAVLSKQIMRKYLDFNLHELNNPDFYNQYTQVLKDFPVRVISMQDTVCNFIGSILSLFTIITLMISINPVMILISIVGIAANLFLSPVLNQLGYQKYLEKTIDTRIQEYIKRVFYIFDYVKDLKLHFMDNFLFKKYEASNVNLINIIKKYGNKDIFYITLMGLINLISFFIILIYLASMAIKGFLSMGEVSALYNATEQLRMEAISFFSIIPRFMENSLYVDNYLSFLSMNDKTESEDGIPIKSDIKSIVFDGVSYSYNNMSNQLALDSIHLTISNNEKIALVGHNGAGKSTFVNLLTRLYDPLDGKVLFNDENYKNLNLLDLRKQFLVIFQDSQIFAATIAENILMHEISNLKDEEIVVDTLIKVGLYDKILTFPDGINSMLTKEFNGDGIVLSGGEKQKIMVARVLASNAKIIVLDEVTSNMDAISEHEIFEQIIRFAENKIVIYISHKLSTTKLADKIYLLEKGSILEQGSHKELMNLGGKYKEMFLIQAEKYGDN